MLFRTAALLYLCLNAFAGSSAQIAVSGGISLNGNLQPFLFTWNAAIPIAGSGFSPGESVMLTLHGPLNSPQVIPYDVSLGSAVAGPDGSFSAAPVVPFDGGATGPGVRIPRPGFYALQATGTASGLVVAADNINLCPATDTTGGTPFDWGHERGGRDGVLPGTLRHFSPERADPEWPTVWDELPIELYGTVAPAGDDGGSQPARISHTDNPITHYGHDAKFTILPDPNYRWLAGTSNYNTGGSEADDAGGLGIEWETLNGGGTSAYAQGSIGLPLWAMPTAGDRVYLLGRWILDAGHPEIGDRTEVHPPRLVATMRQRPALASRSGGAAAQVDIYLSGHGGGANRMPAGLSAALNQAGYGGGRIRDALSRPEQDRYYRAGPLSFFLSFVLLPVIQNLAGFPPSSTIFQAAGPSAFPWGPPSPEEHAVNDMDYDFDVPLPPRPDGATAPFMDVLNQPQHATAVTEQVTYTNPVNGFPTIAHIHLPYKGADNAIYARTLKFSWDTSPPPVSHFQVALNDIQVFDTEGKWHLWADVSGQWSYLSGLNPGLLDTKHGQRLVLPPNQTDVWLGQNDALRILVQGYRAACVDGYFGKLFGRNSYSAGFTFLQDCGTFDNDDLGGAFLELAPPVAPGVYTVPSTGTPGKAHFAVNVTVTALP